MLDLKQVNRHKCFTKEKRKILSPQTPKTKIAIIKEKPQATEPQIEIH